MSSLKNHNLQTAGFLFGLDGCSKNNGIFLKAYRKGEFESLKFMLDNDMISDFSHSDSYGNNILHYAVVNEDAEFITYLLDHVKNSPKVINHANNKGDTPLHVAVKRGFTDIGDILINRGADMSIKNKDGFYVKKVELDNQMLMDLATPDESIINNACGANKVLSILGQKMNKPNYYADVVTESAISPTEIFVTDYSKQPQSPEINDTEDLFKLLNKFNLIDTYGLDNQSGGGRKGINGTRKIITTLKGSQKKI